MIKKKKKNIINIKKIIKEYSENFQKQLFNKKNSFALKYLKDRKLSEDTIKFQIGYVHLIICLMNYQKNIL